MSTSKKPKLPPKASLKSAFVTIIWPRRRILAVGLLLIVISRACGLVLPASIKILVDDIITPNQLGKLGPLVGIVALAVLVQSVTSYALVQLLSVEAQLLISKLRARVQKHILHLPLRYFDNTKSGELVSRIMTDAEGVRNLVGTGLVQLIGGLLTAVAAFVILLKIQATLTFVALIPAVLFGVISTRAFKIIRPVFRERGRINAEVTGRLTESLGGIRVIKGFNAEAREEHVFELGVTRLFENVKKSLTTTSFVTSLATGLMGLASVALMWMGAHRITGGDMTTGDFFSFMFFLALLISPIVQMSNIGSQITEALAGLDRMNEILHMPLEEDDPTRTVQLDRIEGQVRFEDVQFAYDPETPVLHGINFEAAPGSVIALVGSSGSGKSTIAGLAASFMQPDQGRVLVDGQDLAKVQLSTYRKQLGLVLQDDFLFEGTIRENILFARPDATEAQLQEAVKSANVAEFVDRFEAGLETIIGERGVKLSGGQRQRVAIARALLADPRILILDEATSNLDTESEAYIQASLALLMRGRTTLVIAHRLSTIQRADTILVIESGQIAERGTHEELLALGGRYHRLYTYQARI
ncbi:MAG: ABC transporter ATP-binding protein [Planctomycetes bacterium]|nr:ABC transporter ATP-binding protein [Planctomycetota bacterium]MCB9910259.1 ABC transporter ATP-binding protein [Planctomycetota bacterium]HPF12894.1 ABC transporter ATP-binding protein [Planctomycetota bacterium]